MRHYMENTDDRWDNLPKISPIESLLLDGRLAETASSLSALLRGGGLRREADYIDDQARAYRYMLDFAATGGDDPGRDYVISDLTSDLYEMMEYYLVNTGKREDPSPFYSCLRLDRVQGRSLDDVVGDYLSAATERRLAIEAGEVPLEVTQRCENALAAVFDKVAALPFYAVKEYKRLLQMCLDPEIAFEFKATVAGAMYYSLLHIFNRRRFLWLFDLLEATDDERLQARLSVYLFLIESLRNVEFHENLRVKDAAERWTSSIFNYTRMRDVIMQFLQAVDTKRINEKLKNEIIPGLRSISPDFVNRMKEKMKDNPSPEEMEEMGMNPEWEEMLRKSGLDKKMRELSEMQSQGADVMMMPLAQLKQHRFFSRISNWFLPFSLERSELKAFAESCSSGVREMLESESDFCDSDKYSIALTINSMPEATAKMMLSQLNAGYEQMKEELKDRMLRVEHPAFLLETIRHMRDLFRFHTLSRGNKDIQNPFKWPGNFIYDEYMKVWTLEEEVMRLLGEFYFSRGYYKEAGPLLSRITEIEEDNVSLWEKLGYCFQADKDYPSAIHAYLKAELLSSGSSWLYNKLAYCYTCTGDYGSALKYYKRRVDLDSENVKKVRSAILGAIRAEEYAEAVQLAQRAEYLEEDNVQNLRLLVLAAALAGNRDLADRCSATLALSSAASDDADSKMVLAFSSLLGNRYKDALEYLSDMGKDAEEISGKVMKELDSLRLHVPLGKQVSLALEMLRLRDNKNL